jgi:high-affinity iron transporter
LRLKVAQATDTRGAWTLFGLAFVAVAREGIETTLFLTAATFTTSTRQTLLGGSLGLVVAACLGWVVFAGGKRLDVGRFFRVTGGMLLLFAAGLVAHGVHEFQEVGWLPTLVEHLWNLNPLLDETGVLGSFLRALFGYNGYPSLIEVLGYLAYLAVVSVAILKALGQQVGRLPSHARRNASNQEAERA